MDGNIFLQVSAILAVTATIAFVIRLLRQPLLVAYLIAGVVSGPFVLNFLRGDEATFSAFADFGVVLLLFAVGLNLNLQHLREIGRPAVLAGVAQFVFTAVVGYLLLLLIPMPTVARAYLAIAVTFSSTIVIMKLLSDKGHAQRLYGRQAIGLMVVQDLIAVAILLVLATMHAADAPLANLGFLILRGIAVLAAVALLARFVLPPLLERVARSGEHLFVTTVAWCFAVASLIHAAGFSLEIGALIAGISIGSSPYQPEIVSRVRPLRDFFLVLFFIILGSEMQFGGVREAALPALILSLFILIGNPIILYRTYRALRYTRRNSFLIGLTAAQVSEFGFVLIVLGGTLGHLHGIELSIFTLTALATFIASTYLVTYGGPLYTRVAPLLARFGADHHRQQEGRDVQFDALVFGYHRIGWKICEALSKRGVPFAVIDDDPSAIAKLSSRGVPCYFGDATDVDFLEDLPLASTKLIVSTLPDAHDQLVLIRFLKHRRPKARIIANTEHVSHLNELYDTGADFVMMPHLLGGTWMADVLFEKNWSAATFRSLREEQREEMQLRYTLGTHA